MDFDAPRFHSKENYCDKIEISSINTVLLGSTMVNDRTYGMVSEHHDEDNIEEIRTPVPWLPMHFRGPLC
jgi:hypothetical protein